MAKIFNFDQEYYDDYACKYEWKIDQSRILVDMIARQFNPQRILDVGCGMGYTVSAFRAHNIEAYGVDISKYAINKSPDDIREFLQICNICKGIKFEDGFFDVVVSFSTLDYITDLEVPILEISRILRKGGYAIIGFWGVTLLRSTKMIYPHLTYHHEMPKKTWIDLFSSSGLVFKGDLLRNESSTLLNRLKYSDDIRLIQMKPESKVGEFLNRLGGIGKQIRVRLNVLIWGREQYLIFRRE